MHQTVRMLTSRGTISPVVMQGESDSLFFDKFRTEEGGKSLFRGGQCPLSWAEASWDWGKRENQMVPSEKGRPEETVLTSRVVSQPPGCSRWGEVRQISPADYWKSPENLSSFPNSDTSSSKKLEETGHLAGRLRQSPRLVRL
jgi:hypothetical protein